MGRPLGHQDRKLQGSRENNMSRDVDVLRQAHYRINGSSADVRVDPGQVLLDALKAAGYAVVELPKPDQDDEDGIGWCHEPLADWGVFVSRDIVDGRVYDQNAGVQPAGARLIASWWLAAADAAEVDR